MKLLVIFVHEEDVPATAEELRNQRLQFTMLHSTSGFLGDDSRTFLLGLEDEQVDTCKEVFTRHCRARQVGAPGSFLAGQVIAKGEYMEKLHPVMVEIGGATGFMIDVERVI